MRKTIILLLLVLSGQTAFGQTIYKTYINARFGYSIAYPSSLLEPQGEADNGDGQIFKNDNAEMRVYGTNLLLNETLEKEYQALLEASDGIVAYKLLRTNFFVISVRSDGEIYYRKTIEKDDGAFVTFEIRYKESKKKIYDKAVKKIVKSFKVLSSE